MRTKLIWAGAIAIGLLDLQIYVNSYHKRTEMLGDYLRKRIEVGPCTRLASAGHASKCLEATDRRAL